MATSIAQPQAPPAAPNFPAELHVRVENLRSDRGLIQACITRDPARFPDCKADPKALRARVSAKDAATMRFQNVPIGGYALALIHDENANGRLDKVAGLPREGFGFSRNPAIRFGPPKFEEARIMIAPGRNNHTIRMRYLL